MTNYSFTKILEKIERTAHDSDNYTGSTPTTIITMIPEFDRKIVTEANQKRKNKL